MTSTKLEFAFGPYVPIHRRDEDVFIDPKGIVDAYFRPELSSKEKRLTTEVLPEDSIVEAPSLLTPLLLKKKTLWPKHADPCSKSPMPGERQTEAQEPSGTDQSTVTDPDTGSDVQIVKVIDHTATDHVNNNRPRDEYIRATTVASLTYANSLLSQLLSNQTNQILSINDYFETPCASLLQGIGLSLVREHHLHHKHKCQMRRLKHVGDGRKTADGPEEIEALQKELDESRTNNAVFKPKHLYKCPRCPFKTEFAFVMSGHLEVPHASTRKEVLCNWCEFKTTDTQRMVFHCITEHKKRTRVEKPIPLHQCRYCPYENRSRAKMTSHLLKCEKIFLPLENLNLKETEKDGYPAITPKFIDKEDIKCYESTLRSLRLASYNPHQLRVPQGQGNQPILLIPRQGSNLAANAVPLNGQQTVDQMQNGQCNTNGARNMFATAVQGVAVNQAAGNAVHYNQSAVLMNLLAAQGSSQANYSGIIQHPRRQSSFVNGRSVLKTAPDIVMAPISHHRDMPSNDNTATSNQQTRSESLDLNSDLHKQQQLVGSTSPHHRGEPPNSKSSTFVICEICDAYIKDLIQLKSHMHWVHKVKIHQKTLLSRPPLSCQKCDWRFFTDQGLERHLLGHHGLLTSNMKELADQGRDCGRCTKCGRPHAKNLVAHMKEEHQLNLKPAYLTYKCTVCKAQFNLYRLFESHVYSVHSDSVKKVTSG